MIEIPFDSFLENLKQIVESDSFPNRATVWQKSDKLRVYYKSRQGVKLFSDWGDGWSLQCFIDDCGQHPNWYKSQREELIGSVKDSHNILVGLTYIEEPVTGYSEELNNEFNGYRDTALSILGVNP